MSEQRALVLRKGFIGTCALAALVLLASFYSIVSGAVDRAARQRNAAGSGSTATMLGAATHPRRADASLLARVGD